MQFLTDASRELFNRPDDGHFESFDALKTSAVASQALGEEVSVPASEIIVVAREEADPLGAYGVQLQDGRTVDPNNYSMNQLCTGAKVPMPLLERLSPATGAKVLNESLRHEDVTDRRALLENTENGNPRLRAITSDSYFRVWDSEILQDIERWLLPMGFKPALPTINTDAQQRNILGNSKPALFRGDRDSFSFFYTDKEDGDTDGFGGLRRGFMVGNSEVGARAAVYRQFFFRDMCANFLIWDASQVETRRQVHRGERNMRMWFLEMRDAIQRLSVEVGGKDLERFQKAAQVAFAGDGSPTDANKAKAAQRLNRQFRVPKGPATDAVEAALLPLNQSDDPKRPQLSPWTVANGLTWEAKDSRFAGKLLDFGIVGQEVLNTVEV
jgi:hypothetical protein